MNEQKQRFLVSYYKRGQNHSQCVKTSSNLSTDPYILYSEMVSYLSLSKAELSSKVEELWNRLESCKLCGWNCGVNRLQGQKGKCQAGKEIEVSSSGPHYGEERPLVGRHGSGTIFLTHCSVSCVYCQNWQISQAGAGQEKSLEDVADIMIHLQEKGCHNINWVTPSHYVPQLVKALTIAREKGLKIPIVYNTGGYDSVETIKALEGIVDIYMPDMKYGSNVMAKKYSQVPNYWDINKQAVKEMHRQVGDLQITERGIAKQGLLVRHLVLPQNITKSNEVLKYIAKNLSKDTYVNIMAQYRPCYKANEYPELNQSMNFDDVRKVKQQAQQLGLHRGF